MFERFTLRARRVIFFARFESCQFGSTSIETEHLLLGVLREDANLPGRFLGDPSVVHAISESARAWVPVRETNSGSTDLPLSPECRRILVYAREEADGLNHVYVGVEHLVLGILREEKCNAAEILRKHGLQLNAMREQLIQSLPPQAEEE